jgi:2-haloacid dehalogenase
VLTLVGEFRALHEIARAVDEKLADALGDVDAYSDASEALGLLSDEGVPAYILTNGGAITTRSLVEKAGLASRITEVFSVDDVERFKPDPVPYRYAVEQIGAAAGSVTLIAAHEWDVLGARNAGLRAIFVDRDDRGWRLPVAPAPAARDLVSAVRLAIRQ